LEDSNLYLRLWKIYAANGKVSHIHRRMYTNEIIPSINRSFVYKAKEGGHVRISNIWRDSRICVWSH